MAEIELFVVGSVSAEQGCIRPTSYTLEKEPVSGLLHWYTIAILYEKRDVLLLEPSAEVGFQFEVGNQVVEAVGHGGEVFGILV